MSCHRRPPFLKRRTLRHREPKRLAWGCTAPERQIFSSSVLPQPGETLAAVFPAAFLGHLKTKENDPYFLLSEDVLSKRASSLSALLCNLVEGCCS